MRPLKAFAPVCLVHRCMPCAPSSLVQDRVWCWMDLHSGELLRSTHPRTLWSALLMAHACCCCCCCCCYVHGQTQV